MKIFIIVTWSHNFMTSLILPPSPPNLLYRGAELQRAGSYTAEVWDPGGVWAGKKLLLHPAGCLESHEEGQNIQHKHGSYFGHIMAVLSSSDFYSSVNLSVMEWVEHKLLCHKKHSWSLVQWWPNTTSWVKNIHTVILILLICLLAIFTLVRCLGAVHMFSMGFKSGLRKVTPKPNF